jgi:hypothetical protein
MRRIFFSALAVFAVSLFSPIVRSEGQTKGQVHARIAEGLSAQHPDGDAPAERIGFPHGKAIRAGLEQPRQAPVRPRRFEGAGLLGVLRRVPQQYATIQAGINASVHGDTVLVSEGTYLENIKYRGKRIIVASVYLLDQDTSHISRTIIDGSQPVFSDSGSVVSFVSGEDTNSVLCGFTVRDGYGTYIPAWDEADGGGVFLWQSSGRLVRNIITGNNVEASSAWGGGVSMTGLTNSGQTLIMEDNIISRNIVTAAAGVGFGGGVSIVRSQFRLTGNVFEHDTVRGPVQAGGSGAVVFSGSGNLGVISGNVFSNNIALGDSSTYACLTVAQYDGDVAIDSNLFEGNSVMSMNRGAFGGAIHIDDYFSTSLPEKRITRNVIRRNRLTSSLIFTFGAAMFLWDARRVGVAENLIQDNISQAGTIAYGGGIYGISWGGTIENNIITGNIGTYGGGIGHTGAPPSGMNQTMVNNTVCRNQAEFGGGLWGSSTTTSILLNNIFWDDSSSNGEIDVTGSVEVHYSNIEGGWNGGAGNINVNPLFADTLYRLANASPCIGAGRDSVQIGGIWYRAPALDFGGNSRPIPLGSQPDMGAWENPLGNPTSVGDAGGSQPNAFDLVQSYPNPFNPSTTIRFTIPIGTYGQTSLRVYDVLGREVVTLVNEEKRPGTHRAEWNAAGVASGVYFYTLETGGSVATKKLILMR